MIEQLSSVRNQTVGLLHLPQRSGALTLSSHPVALQHADNEGMDRISRPVLSLVRPGCGGAFPSAMQMEPRTFEGIRISNLLECCPKCSRVSRFSKADYLFRSEIEIRLAEGGRARRASGEGLLPVVRRPPDRLGPPRT
jgi:hypothetical protein